MTITITTATIMLALALAPPSAATVPYGPEPVQDTRDTATLKLNLPDHAHADVERASTGEAVDTLYGEDITELPPGDYRIRVGASHRSGETTRWRRTLSLRAGEQEHLKIEIRRHSWPGIVGLPLSVIGLGLFSTGVIMAGGTPPLHFDRASGSLFGVGLGLVVVALPMLSRWNRPRLRMCTLVPHRSRLGIPCT